MTKYRHVFDSVSKGDVIDIPDEAVGVNVDTFSDLVTVHYLLPDGHSALEDNREP